MDRFCKMDMGRQGLRVGGDTIKTNETMKYGPTSGWVLLSGSAGLKVGILVSSKSAEEEPSR